MALKLMSRRSGRPASPGRALALTDDRARAHRRLAPGRNRGPVLPLAPVPAHVRREPHLHAWASFDPMWRTHAPIYRWHPHIWYGQDVRGNGSRAAGPR